jgi:DNA-binding GntR family transcriptional regulator
MLENGRVNSVAHDDEQSEGAAVTDSGVNRPRETQFGLLRPVQRNGGTAVWQQLRADLLSRIENGGLAPGDALPPETALAEAYRVSRLTVRRALADLARIGVVRTEHGVGSFVATRPLRHRIDDGQVSLLESMAKQGHAVRQRILDIRRVDPAQPAELAVTGTGTADAPTGAYEFSYFPGAVMEYRYIRWVDELPWSVSFAAVPAALAPPDWDGSTSLFAAMTGAHGVDVYRDDRRFSAVPATPEDAAWLEIPVGAPLLLLRGTNSDERGRAVAYIVHRIRGDRAEYGVRVPR